MQLESEDLTLASLARLRVILARPSSNLWRNLESTSHVAVLLWRQLLPALAAAGLGTWYVLYTQYATNLGT